MKNTFKLLGIIALAAVIVFSFITCDTGTTPSATTPPAASGSDEFTFTGGNYTLTIFKNGSSRAAAYIPAVGDFYEIRDKLGEIVSKGSITEIVNDTYTFKPDSGKPTFSGSASPNMAAIQITSPITLDDDRQLPGLSLSNSEDTGSKVTVYTSYKAAADAGYLFHNGRIDSSLGTMERMNAFSALMQTLDYTCIKIDSKLPISSDFRFDFSVIKNTLDLQANDYYKWDIEYNDHRVLVRYYLFDNGVYNYGYSLVNEVLLLPVINGTDYSAGRIRHIDFEYGVTNIDWNVINNPDNRDNFSIRGKAPVDNLGLLQTYRIVDAVRTARNYTLRAGDYFNWTITYDDSVWSMICFIQIVNANGSVNLWSGSATRLNAGSGPRTNVLFTGRDASLSVEWQSTATP